MIGGPHISGVNSNRTSLWEQAEFLTSCYIKRWKERHFETCVSLCITACCDCIVEMSHYSLAQHVSVCLSVTVVMSFDSRQS